MNKLMLSKLGKGLAVTGVGAGLLFAGLTWTGEDNLERVWLMFDKVSTRLEHSESINNYLDRNLKDLSFEYKILKVDYEAFESQYSHLLGQTHNLREEYFKLKDIHKETLFEKEELEKQISLLELQYAEKIEELNITTENNQLLTETLEVLEGEYNLKLEELAELTISYNNIVNNLEELELKLTVTETEKENALEEVSRLESELILANNSAQALYDKVNERFESLPQVSNEEIAIAVQLLPVFNELLAIYETETKLPFKLSTLEIDKAENNIVLIFKPQTNVAMVQYKPMINTLITNPENNATILNYLEKIESLTIDTTEDLKLDRVWSFPDNTIRAYINYKVIE